MSTNGRGRPAHQRIEMPSAAEPSEAAAVVAAVEQFLADMQPTAQPVASANPWQRAALVEGVSAKRAFGPSQRREPWQ